MANPSDPDPDGDEVDNPTGAGKMAGSSEPDEPQLEPPRGIPVAERDEGPSSRYGATELARLRRNYSRASSYHHPGSSVASKKPTSLRGRVLYGLESFWGHQISITVDHDTCRDHLGECLPVYVLC